MALRFLIPTVLQIACIAGVACHNPAFRTIPTPTLRYAGEAKIIPGQLEAQQVYIEKIKETYHVDVAAVPTKVYWVKPAPCPGFAPGKTGLFYVVEGEKEGCYWGLTYACGEMYVVETYSISHSALVHELGHCYYIHVFGERDGDHTDTAWWSLVDSINNSLAQETLARAE